MIEDRDEPPPPSPFFTGLAWGCFLNALLVAFVVGVIRFLVKP